MTTEQAELSRALTIFDPFSLHKRNVRSKQIMQQQFTNSLTAEKYKKP